MSFAGRDNLQRRGRWPETYTGSPIFVTRHKLAASDTDMVTHPSDPGGEANGVNVPCSATARSKYWLYGIGAPLMVDRCRWSLR
jgi:hypothetical protein